MRSAGSAGSPDPESNSKPRVGSLTLASPLLQLAVGHSPSTADGLVPLLVEMVKQKDIFSVAADMLHKSVMERGFQLLSVFRWHFLSFITVIPTWIFSFYDFFFLGGGNN